VKRKLALALFVLSASAWAVPAARDAAREAALDHEVGLISPELVASLHEGNAAMDRGDAAAAAKAYARVHEGAPEVFAVTRRLCTAETRSGNPQAAIAHCREAVEKQGSSAENHAALALALIAGGQVSDVGAARHEADVALDLAPHAEFAETTICEVALATSDFETIDDCSAALRKIAPKSATTHLFSAVAYANKNDWDNVDAELGEARAAGIDEATYEKMHDRVQALRPRERVEGKIISIVSMVAGAWLAVMFVLLVLGLLLGDAVTKTRSRAVVAAHRGLLLASVVMFYVSALLASVSLVGLIALLALFFLSLAGASRTVEAAFGAVGAYLLVATTRALFGSVPPRDLGARVKEVALDKALAKIAKRMRARPLDAVYAQPGASLEVVAQGGVWRHLHKRETRSLVIGVGALDGLSARAFEALVASEIIRAGDVAIVERAALDDLAARMEARGVAIAANPAWIYVRLQKKFFELVSEGAVVAREDLADQRAAKAYGSETLGKGLRHVARRSVDIEARAASLVNGWLAGENTPDNVYEHKPEQDMRQAMDDAVAALGDRLERIESLEEEGFEEATDDAAAWSLFSDRAALERTMTDRMREALRCAIDAGDQESKARAVARA
jgi:hypothetical protein